MKNAVLPKLGPLATACLVLSLLAPLLSACQFGQQRTKGSGKAPGAQGTAQSQSDSQADGGSHSKMGAEKGLGGVSTIFVGASDSMQKEELDLDALHAAMSGLSPAGAYEQLQALVSDPTPTAICKAAQTGKGRVIALYIATGGDVNIAAEDAPYETPLLSSVCGGYSAITELLLEHHADIEYRDKQMQGTPLLWAAMLGNTEMVKLLQKHGADIRAKNGQRQMNGAILAAQFGNDETLEYLLEAGIPVDETEQRDLSPLIFAAKAGYLNCVKVLVEHGADVNRAEKDRGFTPLLGALYMLHFDVADYLIEQGADPQHSMQDGGNAISIVTPIGKAEGIEWLVRHDYDLNWQHPESGTTALMLAIRAGSPLAVKALLDHGADPELKDKQGLSARDFARRSTDAQIRSLLNVGTDKAA